ncbi:MAG TPA: hypothetical protein P5132_02490 [Bacteroidales bacterium]|nr:hypothetical protein [Bacteroidales bacterium]
MKKKIFVMSFIFISLLIFSYGNDAQSNVAIKNAKALTSATSVCDGKCIVCFNESCTWVGCCIECLGCKKKTTNEQIAPVN